MKPIKEELLAVNEEIEKLRETQKDKKDEEIAIADKEALKSAEEKADGLKKQEEELLTKFANKIPLVSQLIDLALLSNNMLKGEALSKFIKRSVEML